MTSSLGAISLPSEISANGMAEFMQACSQFVQKQWGVQYTEFTMREFPAGQQQILTSAWEFSQPGTLCLDLRPGRDGLWARMKPRARRHIRKSQQMGMQIVPFTDARRYYQMLDETFARRGTLGWHPEQFFRLLIEELVPRDMVWAWGAQYEGQIIAAGLFLHDDQEMFYLSGASLSQYRHLPTSYLLHWHAIGAAITAGLHQYDLAGRSIASIAHFKEAFNPEAVEYVGLTWCPAHVRYAKKLFLSSRPHFERFKRLIHSLSA
jgi:lipid II:glycine glycyltransferase (peptidoglycan interpeptide bridge formation enzyme)